MINRLLSRATSIAEACAFLRPEKVTSATEDQVTLASQTFANSFVAQKLYTPGMTAVGYVATCGRALHNARADYAACKIQLRLIVPYRQAIRKLYALSQNKLS